MSLVPGSAWPEPSKLLRRARRAVNNALKGRAGLLCVLAVMFAASYAASVDWREVAASLASGRPSYPVDLALLAEAKRLRLDYDTVASDPAAHAGKPVLWCLVRQTGMDRPVVNGNLSWTVDLQGADIEAVATGRMGVCKPTLAVVEKSDEPGVHLHFAGHP